ncbi:hypothetical protein N658DRAFT_491611 [Parathielavia hyrcaniae]|uniref:Uncharacterized protein n=1 Tax=Parathielavia hyrcaniae TaxID=113614 RepID=A0AAN6Q7N9_9PEZI|nr:hypothetical protein N658DRAFT_491611 [Parathielavia hyrcaniae]
MSTRPQNIGIKAVEIYFPSQVRVHASPLGAGASHSRFCRPPSLTARNLSTSSKPSSRSSMASALESTQLASARQR